VPLLVPRRMPCAAGPKWRFKMAQRMEFKKATSAVVSVGDGRGFIIVYERHDDGCTFSDRPVITAAHCLPDLPPCHGMPDLEEKTYKKLLAPLGGEPAVSCECLFVDPVADIAVLGTPDAQTYFDEAAAFDELVDPVTPLEIAAPGTEGWLLSLDGAWFRCKVIVLPGHSLMLTDLEGNFDGGMSGSPIISADGAAIGVACLGGEDLAGNQREAGPNPSLVSNLPGWLQRKL
jgi:hypothetical protein